MGWTLPGNGFPKSDYAWQLCSWISHRLAYAEFPWWVVARSSSSKAGSSWSKGSAESLKIRHLLSRLLLALEGRQIEISDGMQSTISAIIPRVALPCQHANHTCICSLVSQSVRWVSQPGFCTMLSDCASPHLGGFGCCICHSCFAKLMISAAAAQIHFRCLLGTRTQALFLELHQPCAAI